MNPTRVSVPGTVAQVPATRLKTAVAKYTSGEYAELNPTWHAEDSAWKAVHILRMMERSGVRPRTICDVGCGAGEILRQLHDALGSPVTLAGYDISPQAHALSRARASERLSFHLADFLETAGNPFDVILIIDVIEHLEDYLGFLRALRMRARYKILHIPLEVSVLNILRPRFFDTVRMSAGHLHHFTKETALSVVRDAGYRVLQCQYTGGAVELPATSVKMQLAKLPRRLLFKLWPDLAVRLVGGYSLLILAE